MQRRGRNEVRMTEDGKRIVDARIEFTYICSFDCPVYQMVGWTIGWLERKIGFATSKYIRRRQ